MIQSQLSLKMLLHELVGIKQKATRYSLGKCCSRVGIGSLTYYPALKSARYYSFVRSYNFYNTSEKLFVKRFLDTRDMCPPMNGTFVPVPGVILGRNVQIIKLMGRYTNPLAKTIYISDNIQNMYIIRYSP
jgi:hypothetical protein